MYPCQRFNFDKTSICSLQQMTTVNWQPEKQQPPKNQPQRKNIKYVTFIFLNIIYLLSWTKYYLWSITQGICGILIDAQKYILGISQTIKDSDRFLYCLLLTFFPKLLLWNYLWHDKFFCIEKYSKKLFQDIYHNIQ